MDLNNKVVGSVCSVNISEKKGTIKVPVEKITLTDLGVLNDAHSGDWHRQVSLLGLESVRKFTGTNGRIVKFGEFAENITTDGLELFNLQIGDKLIFPEAEIEVTQIGKECHGNNCAIFKEVGNCVMPKEGIFCKVIKNGSISAGEKFTFNPDYLRILVITLSDRASIGEYDDRSGPVIEERIKKYFEKENIPKKINRIIIPDDSTKFKTIINQQINEKTDIIVTTGGTGIGPRDITIDTLLSLNFKNIPGVMEMVRTKNGLTNANALLSRSVCGIFDETLIYALPGSVKAVNEYFDEIERSLKHILYMKKGIDIH